MTSASFPDAAGRKLGGRRHLFHPSRRRLEDWLDGGATDIDDHLATCDRCANRLEASAAPTLPIAEFVAAALAPPADLAPRLRAAMARRMQNRDDLSLLASMLGVPWETIQTVITPPDGLGREVPDKGSEPDED